MLQFLRKILDVPLGYSKDDLILFREMASRDFPPFAKIIDEYIRLAERAGSDVVPIRQLVAGRPHRKASSQQMHLFDLLREKQLFASNNELTEFAKRVLPNIKGHRFNKMSRGDIAARIVEYLESKDPRTREELELSMRDAMAAPAIKPAERKSFLSKWERIIKGIEF